VLKKIPEGKSQMEIQEGLIWTMLKTI